MIRMQLYVNWNHKAHFPGVSYRPISRRQELVSSQTGSCLRAAQGDCKQAQAASSAFSQPEVQHIAGCPSLRLQTDFP